MVEQQQQQQVEEEAEREKAWEETALRLVGTVDALLKRVANVRKRHRDGLPLGERVCGLV